MGSSELARRLARIVRARGASTFYLDGAPGSGKSRLLRELAEQFPAEVPRCQVLGPYSVAGSGALDLAQRILRDCAKLRFADGSPPLWAETELPSAWRWLGEAIHAAGGQSFLVLVDLSGDDPPDQATAASLFSAARYLEGAWSHPAISICHLFAGYWDQRALEGHYKEIQTSFPYTSGHNQAVWDGICVEDMVKLLSEARADDGSSIFLGRILFELTAGHPAAALDILDRIPKGHLKFPALLEATRQAAADGPAGRALIRVWTSLPAESRTALRSLALVRTIRVKAPPPHLESLLIAGAVRRNRVGSGTYLSLRSWYTTLLVLLHAQELGIADDQVRRIRIEDLTPQAFELNAEAYRLIKDIEAQARNFVAVQLCLKCDGNEPILMNRMRKFNTDTQSYTDAQRRASEWQARCAARGLPVALNPPLAYLAVRDLGELITEIATETATNRAWLSIGQAIQDLADVRDAVMHNQLIDDAALQRLYDLQAAIHEALCWGT